MNYYLKECSEIFLLKYLKCTKITIFIVISPKSGKKKHFKAKKKHKKPHKKVAGQKKSTKKARAFQKHSVRALPCAFKAAERGIFRKHLCHQIMQPTFWQ